MSIAAQVQRDPERFNGGAQLFGDLNTIIGRRRVPCVFLSPHLDDAACSNGGWLHTLARTTDNVILINIFTRRTDPSRLREEHDAKRILGGRIETLDLRLVDASHRSTCHDYRRSGCRHAAPGRRRYCCHDADVVYELEEGLREALAAYPSAVIVSPLGARTGTHIDHIMTRDACTSLFPGRVVYSLDYPYSRWQHAWVSSDQRFMHKHGLVPALFNEAQDVRARAIACYSSQLPTMFPHGSMPTTMPAEVYYVSEHIIENLSFAG
jgi:LmbE family N-acetylglucosaminyl deacetylase